MYFVSLLNVPHNPFCTGYTSNLLLLLDVPVIISCGKCMPNHIQLGEVTLLPEGGIGSELDELFQWTRFRIKLSQTNYYFVVQ